MRIGGLLTGRRAVLSLVVLAFLSLLAVVGPARPYWPTGRHRILFLSTDCDGDASKFLASKAYFLAPNRTFDVAVVDFSEGNVCAPLLAAGADRVFHRPQSFKYDALHSVLASAGPGGGGGGVDPAFARHSRFLLCDADIDFPGGSPAVDLLFDLSERLDLFISQASLSNRSEAPHAALRRSAETFRRGGVGRRAGIVEIMCPLFSRRALEAYLPDFRGQKTGWGMDILWAWGIQSKLRYGDWEGLRGELMAVVDAVEMEHLRPVSDKNMLYERTGGQKAAFFSMGPMLKNRTGMELHQALYFLDRVRERTGNLYSDGVVSKCHKSAAGIDKHSGLPTCGQCHRFFGNFFSLDKRCGGSVHPSSQKGYYYRFCTSCSKEANLL
ncbi:hypothetical protein DFJ74DRAFT_707334 [Hyaloraphidium curvatum]|nr:hypothetical protein DFJ74DRAFT_707334 [Hyaloraphidium curvatum]